MPILKVTLEDIYNLIDQLDQDKKMAIFERLKSQLLAKKWDSLFTRIDEKLKVYPISEEEVRDEVERAREEFSTGRG